MNINFYIEFLSLMSFFVYFVTNFLTLCSSIDLLLIVKNCFGKFLSNLFPSPPLTINAITFTLKPLAK